MPLGLGPPTGRLQSQRGGQPSQPGADHGDTPPRLARSLEHGRLRKSDGHRATPTMRLTGWCSLIAPRAHILSKME